jgi:glycine/D-amino acid oxidase-like deaminating enzyme
MMPNGRDGGARREGGAREDGGARGDGGVRGGVRERAVRALAGALPQPYWTSQPGAPAPAPALTGQLTADLAVVGGGFSGLWTALLARERDPSADVILIEAGTTGWAASGRNGGFCSASLTHGIGNGLARFPGEMPLLEKLGAQNLAEIGETIAARGIDCGFSPVGELTIATQPWQLDDLHGETGAARRLGHDVTELDAAGVRRELDSPTFLGGAWYRDTCAMVDPARLARGLRQACLDAGVRLFEHTRVGAIAGDGAALALTTPYGRVRARQAALATGAYKPLLRRIGNFFVPVYDYVLVTEPLSAAQLASLGWRNRQGAADAGNQFHYFRLTDDNRVLWGGYDAVYFNGGRVSPAHDQRPETFARLAGHFFTTFPQLEDVAFEYAWGGAIDTCSRFFAFYGTAHRGRLAYACGHTGLGVGASRFAANVMLDLLSGQRTERTELELVRSRPVPFPPEPARSAVVQLTRASLARADRDAGRRNLWLRTLDRLGLGFDS